MKRRRSTASEQVAAEREERLAYQVMREEIPDLAMPAQRRKPLTPRQQKAVEHYQHAAERLARARQATDQ